MNHEWEAWTQEVMQDKKEAKFSVTGPSAAAMVSARLSLKDREYPFTEIVSSNRVTIAMIFGCSQQECDELAEKIVADHNKGINHGTP